MRGLELEVSDCGSIRIVVVIGCVDSGMAFKSTVEGVDGWMVFVGFIRGF